ncbi:MAG: transposase [Candidatus Thermoplasmatota archaeon]|nr:transposase [Candidatus Thermoplasmatota archaeon]
MSDLKRRSHTHVVIPRFVPTTQTCSRCGNRQEIDLNQRIYSCGKCSLVMDRDLNSAMDILNEHVPAERRELTPCISLLGS